MEDSTGAVEAVTAPALSSAVQQQPRVKQEQEPEPLSTEEAVDQQLKATSKAAAGLIGRLTEPDPSSEDENTEGKAGRGKPAQRRPLRCQVDGCGADLAQARKYFQRYRVCERHLKSPSLQMDGRSVRFCDQCSKFHDITMFEGNRRTCNEKLERTRQARSDKRRQQTEQAEHATMRANGGWRSRPHGAPASLKRQYSERNGCFDYVADEEYELEAAGGCGPMKRSRSLSPPPPPPPPQQLPVAGAAMLASLTDQLEAQGILALHRAAIAAATGGGGAGSAIAATAAGDLHVHLHSGVSGGGRRFADGNGSNDGYGGGGGGGASSRSSWDNGQPHLHLLRMDSVSSRPGSAGGSYGHAHGTSYMPTGAAAAAAGTGSEPTGFLQAYRPAAARDGDEGLQRPMGQGLRPGIGGALDAAAQAAAVLQELYGSSGSGASLAAGHAGGGGSGGTVTIKSGMALQDTRSRVEALLIELLSGGAGGSGASGAVSGIMDSEQPEAPGVPAPSLARRAGSGNLSRGGVGGAFPRTAAVKAFEQQLLLQLQASSMGFVVEPTAPEPYSGARAARVGGGAAVQGTPQLSGGDLYGGGGGFEARDNAGGDGDEATAAALRALVASLAGRRGTTQNDVAVPQRLAGRRNLGEILAATELLLSGFDTSRGASESLIGAGSSGGAAAAASADPDCHLSFRAPGATQREPVAARSMMPVLDLGQSQAYPVPAPPQLKFVGGGNTATATAGFGAGDAIAWKVQHLQQHQHQQALLQRALASDFHEGPAADRRPDGRLSDRELSLPTPQQQERQLLLLLEQQLQEQQRKQSEPDLRPRQQLQQQLQQLLGLVGRGGLASQQQQQQHIRDSNFALQLQREQQKRAAAAVAAEAAEASRQQQQQQRGGRVTHGEVQPPLSPMPQMDGGGEFRHLRHLQERLHQLGVQVVLQ